MRREHQRDFLAALDTLHAVYGKSMRDDVAAWWWESLRRFPFEQVRDALRAMASTSRYMPRLSEVVEHLRDQRVDRDGLASPQDQCSYELHGRQCQARGTVPHGQRLLCRWHAATINDADRAQRIFYTFEAEGVPKSPPDWRDRMRDLIVSDISSASRATEIVKHEEAEWWQKFRHAVGRPT